MSRTIAEESSMTAVVIVDDRYKSSSIDIDYNECLETSEMMKKLKTTPTTKTTTTTTPVISITHSRRCSVSSPLRFTRTFSEDSLDSLEKNGRKELRRQRIMMENGTSPATTSLSAPTSAASTATAEKEKHSLSPLCYTYACPHIGKMGRSRTECKDPSDATLRLPLTAKRSTGDLSCPPSPTRKTLSEFLGLSPYQQKALMQCWPNIYSTGANGQFAMRLYSNLANKNAKARKLLAKANGVAVFANNDMDCSAMHCRVTIELIDAIIKGLDSDHIRLTNYIIEVGRQHRHLKGEGLSNAVWDDLGDSIMESARRSDAVRKHKELRRAWLSIIAFITDNLKQGQSMTRANSSYDITSHDSPKPQCAKKNSGSFLS